MDSEFRQMIWYRCSRDANIGKRNETERNVTTAESRTVTFILPVVLYGCETWTLTLREEHRLRVFENKVLRKIFGAKRDEVTGEWRKLHNTELHALYSSPDIIRNIKSRCLRWAGHVARMGESRNAYRVLVGRPEGKRPLGRPRRRWEDNIKMDLREVGYDDRDWINLAQAGLCEGGNEPPGSLKAICNCQKKVAALVNSEYFQSPLRGRGDVTRCMCLYKQFRNYESVPYLLLADQR
ncbi:hypothetical protein ANN_16462 [Periplaneta americana]|uniref:Uncharacterized protein n=1 Tax=Periplaneta americana TaxID=6978 RepID=A0ABQ8SJ61_PERAM|nr:hypothetical protein ANN_16462 [Periplaneta americana]